MPAPRKQLSSCPIERCVSVLGGRWKTMILFHLLKEPQGFAQLERLLPDCPQRVLTRQLRELERDGVVHRLALGGKPPRVAYRLTAIGDRLAPVFGALLSWGTQHATDFPAGRAPVNHPAPGPSRRAGSSATHHRGTFTPRASS